ncbi:hypothetical protein [Glutamicibacter sp. BSL13]
MSARNQVMRKLANIYRLGNKAAKPTILEELVVNDVPNNETPGPTLDRPGHIPAATDSRESPCKMEGSTDRGVREALILRFAIVERA